MEYLARFLIGALTLSGRGRKAFANIAK